MLESLCGVTKLDMLLTVHDVPLEGGGRGGGVYSHTCGFKYQRRRAVFRIYVEESLHEIRPLITGLGNGAINIK